MKKFNFLSDFELRASAREAWRRQAIADQALERRLARDRLVTQSPLAPEVKGVTMDLFHAKPDK